MSEFDIERDKQFPCFCQACVAGKTEEQMSKKDPRYCLDCYELLVKEAQLLPLNRRAGWIPKPRQKPQNQQGGN